MHTRSIVSGWVGRALVLLALTGCGGGTSGGADSGPVGDAGPVGDVGPSADGSVDTGSPDATAQDGGSSDASACMATPLTAQRVAVFAVLDQSGIMSSPTATGGTRWDGMASGVNAFVMGAPTGVLFGLQYFGLPDPADPSGGTVSCSASVYATPEVALGAASSVATMVSSSLALHSPSSVRATSPGLQGALDYAQSYLASHPDDDVIVALVAGGDPTQCDISLSHLAAEAATARAAGVRTAVITLGPPLPWADAVAAGGETGAATVVGDSGNVPGGVSMGLASAAASRCAFTPPAGVDPTALQIQLRTEAGTQPLTHRMDVGACGTSQGFLVDATGPAPRIVLCPAPCAAYQGATAPVVESLTSC